MNSRPPSAAWPPVAGTKIAGRFELGALVARGGMGTVHQAVDLQTGQRVALKLLADMGVPDAAARFEREARLLAELDHPTIVRFVDAGTVEGGPLYLAMEWLDGEDLSRRLERGPLSVFDAVAVARRIAEGLSVAHAAGIVHRDIKPHNIFLLGGRLDHLKIVDFGIALVAGAQSGITRTGMTIGTPEYMAPEQARGDRAIDARVDVYALGCLLYQAIVGSPPFVGPTPVSVVAELLLSEAPRVGSRARGVPVELDALVAAMLSKEAAARPADGRAVAERLLAIEALPGLSIDAAPGSMSHEERRLMTIVAVLCDADVPSHPDVTVPISAVTGIDSSLLDVARRAGADVSALPDRGAILVFSSGDVASDIAIRAARAAREIAEKGDRRVGVATGPASHRDSTPQDLVRRAVALAAVVGEAHVDDVTSALAASRIAIDRAKTGLRIAGERDGGEDAPPPSSRAAFVGRDREMAALIGAFDASMNDRVAQAVLVVGAPGLGKTRLLRALHDRLRTEVRTVALLDARAEPIRQRAPLALLAVLLRRGLAIPEATPPGERLTMLSTAVHEIVEAGEAGRVTAFLAVALGLTPADPGPEIAAALADPQLMEDQVGRALEDLLEGLATQSGAAAVLVDDGQWADGASLRLLARALRRLRERPIFVAVFARPEIDESAPHLFRDASAERIQLAGLPKRAAERLVAGSLGEQASPEVLAKIVAHAEGNPLFLEELIVAAREGRADDVPATVLATLEARLARLEPGARKVLRAASVFGEAFWQGGVLELIGRDSAEGVSLGHWLVTLVDRDLLVPRRATRFAGQPELAFRHALLRDVAYAMLTEEDRLRGHRLAAAWLAARGESEPAVLAEHEEAAGDLRAAAEHWADAAALAFSHNDLERATSLVERALKQELAPPSRAAALFLACQAHYWAGDLPRAIERGKEAVRAVEPGSQRWVEAMCALGRAESRADDPHTLETARRVIAAVEADPALFPLGQTLADLTAGTLRRGDRALAHGIVTILGGALHRRAPNDPFARAQVYAARSWQAFFDGDLAGCVALDTETLRAQELGGDLRQIAVARVHLGYDFMMLGAYERARDEIAAARELATNAGIDTAEWLAAHNLAWVLHRLGEVEAALELQRTCVKLAVEQKSRFTEMHARNYLARFLLDGGRYDEAETECERALAMADSSSMRWTVLAVMAACAHAKGQAPLARIRIDEALRGAAQFKNVEEGEGLIRLVSIEVSASMGDRVRASRELADAQRWLAASAAKIGDDALRASFLERIPEHAAIRSMSL